MFIEPKFWILGPFGNLTFTTYFDESVWIFLNATDCRYKCVPFWRNYYTKKTKDYFKYNFNLYTSSFWAVCHKYRIVTSVQMKDSQLWFNLFSNKWLLFSFFDEFKRFIDYKWSVAKTNCWNLCVVVSSCDKFDLRFSTSRVLALGVVSHIEPGGIGHARHRSHIVQHHCRVVVHLGEQDQCCTILLNTSHKQSSERCYQITKCLEINRMPPNELFYLLVGLEKCRFVI